MVQKITRIVVLAASLLGMGQPSLSVWPPAVVRVAIVQDQPSIRLAVKGPYRLVAPTTGEVLNSAHRLSTTTVQADAEGLRFGETVIHRSGIRVEPLKDATILVNERSYRGTVEIVPQADATLLAVNHLDVDEYLKGVLSQEVSQHWPMAALEAQAIAARTYALYQRQRNARQPFDVTADVSSQVYGGHLSERWRTTQAVRRTRGLVLTYQGQLFPAYFHAACGGRTEDAGELWTTNLPVLKGVACPYCQDSPHYRWETSIHRKEIRWALKQRHQPVGLVETITPGDRDPSGRWRTINIQGQEGAATLSAKDFREMVGPAVIRSLNFEVTIEGDNVKFAGWGWGHGVGLCQWGARGLAQRGRTAREILVYYYPGATVQEML